MRISLRVALVCAMFGCGSHPGGDDGDITNATLTLDPPTSELLILNGVAATEGFTATLTYPDGTQEDVTADTTFQIDSAFGAFAGPTLSMGAAGKASVLGAYLDKAGTAQVIGRLRDVRVDPSLPPNTPDLFTAPEDAARKPQIVYPPVGVVVPRNLGDFETHWVDPSGNDVFEVSLHTEFTDVRVYVPGGNGLATVGTMPSWTAFKATEWIDAVGQEDTVSFQVRGVQQSNPTTVGAAAPQLVKLTNEPMEGGVYYWATASTSGVYGIFRHDMSKPGQVAEEYMTTNQTAGRCVACHALSRDGTKMAVTYDGGNRNGTFVDVATRVAQPDTNQWNFGTFLPDGNQFISVEAGVMVVRDTATQGVIVTMPATGAVSHPDMSPDGKNLVYTHNSGADYSFNGGQIYVRTYDPTTHAFGAEHALITDGGNNFYPTWSPDNQWILFNRSATGSSYNNADASLWVVKADGSLPPIQLSTANLAAGGLTNSWGRWAPFAQTLGSNGEPVFWITVSSKRDFGVRKRLVDNWPQIWMMSFSPSLATAGHDPSTPAFRLPFQNLDSKNHIAQWTEKIVITL